MKQELWLGDCLELMQNIPDKSIDMILCDLPYGTTASMQIVCAILTMQSCLGNNAN